MYLVYGGNVGTTVTAWLAGIGANSTARRVALVHTLFNVFGTIIFGIFTYLGIYTLFINRITPGDVTAGENIARHIANGHTFFNVLNTIFFLPFAGSLAKLAERIIPKRAEEGLIFGEPKHLNYHLVNDPYLAVGQAVKEMREMLRLVKYAIALSFEAFREGDYQKQDKVDKVEDAIDNLQYEITRYLVAVNEKTNAENIIRKIPALLHTVNDIEKIGDFTVEMNRILNIQIKEQKNPLDPVYLKVIEDLEKKVQIMLDLTLEYMVDFQKKQIYQIIEMEGRINERHRSMRAEILSRIQNGECNAESGLNTIDFIDAMEMIGDKVKNIVKAGSSDFIYYEEARPKEADLAVNTE